MTTTAIDGHGTTITIPGITSVRIIDVNGPGIKRDVIGASNMSTASAEEYIAAALYDGGEVSVTIEFTGNESPQILNELTTTEDLIENITIDWAGDRGAGSYTFSAIMTEFKPKAASKDKMTADVTMKVTGAITVA